MQYRGQHVWSEHYTYDNNSNRLTKTTQYGTINYTYDDENRLCYSGREKLVNLEAEIGGRITFKENEEIYYAATNDSVSYSTNSLKGIRFTYDKNGNMLSSEKLYSVKFFDYNAINRMKLSTVTDLTEHSYTATTYAYDGFGRRTLTQTEGHTANRTLYDSTGFEILRQGTADSNGSFVNYTEAQNRYSPYYPYSGGGYYSNRYGYADYFYYLFFGGIWGFGNGGHGSKNGQEEAPEYLTIENMYPIYANGTVAGTHKEDLVYSPHKHYWNSWTNLWGADTSRYDDYATYKETLYFGTDVLGSVITTSSYSVFDFGSINYDVFGSPYRRAGSFLNSESLDFGYLGKPYNATTELYDYGFRDYSPRNARFTTVDPIRDGRNWYTYVLNDPVNYIDLWGLERSSDRKVYGQVNPKDVKGQFVYISISKSKGTLDLYISRYEDGHMVDKVAGFSVVTNVNRDNPDNSKSYDSNRRQGNDTTPHQVPNGIYEITDERCPSSIDGRYGKNNQGLYVNIQQELVNSAGETVLDGGYEIHITPLYFTNGCIGIQYTLGDDASQAEAEYKQNILNTAYREGKNKGYKTYIEYKN